MPRPQNVAVASVSEYLNILDSRQLALTNRVDLVAPESGGLVATGNLDMKSHDVVGAGTVNYAKMTPAVFGLKYMGGDAGSALSNSVAATSLLPATSIGSLTFTAGRLLPYHVIRFRCGLSVGVTGTPTLTLRLLLNGTAVATHVLSPTTGSGAFMEAELVVTSATNAMVESHAGVNGIASRVINNAAQVIDTSVDNVVTFTGQWSAADPANTVTAGLVRIDWLQY